MAVKVLRIEIKETARPQSAIFQFAILSTLSLDGRMAVLVTNRSPNLWHPFGVQIFLDDSLSGGLRFAATSGMGRQKRCAPRRGARGAMRDKFRPGFDLEPAD